MNQSTSFAAQHNDTNVPLSRWQRSQARFSSTKKSLFSDDDENISSAVLQHMQVPSFSSPQPPAMMLSAFLPMPTTAVRRSSSESVNSVSSFSHQQHQQQRTHNGSSLGLPMVPLRRDHSTGGGRCHRDLLL